MGSMKSPIIIPLLNSKLVIKPCANVRGRGDVEMHNGCPNTLNTKCIIYVSGSHESTYPLWQRLL